MKRYLPEIIICLIFAGIVSIHFSVQFSRLVYIAAEKMNSVEFLFEADDAASDSAVVEAECREDPADPFKCWYPFKDPASGLSANDRPAGHQLFLGLFGLASSLVLGYLVFFRKRELRDCLRVRALKPAMSGREPYLLVLLMAVAIFLRVFHLGTWVVEESEWGAVEHLPLLDIIFHGHEVRHEPPFFTALQHIVYQINSTSLAWTRSLTCLTGILLVAGVWRSSRMIFGPKTALLAAALAAVHPMLVANSHVMRPYSLAVFLLIMVFPHAYRLAGIGTPASPGPGVASDDEQPSVSAPGSFRDVFCFTLFGGLAIWTHYTSLMVLFVLFAYVVASQVRYRTTAGLKPLLLVATGLLVFFLPFIPYFFADFSDKQGGLISNQFIVDIVAAVTGIPLEGGWIVLAFPLVMAVRRARSGRFLLYFDLGLMLVVASTVWMVWWEPTHLMIFVPVLMMLMAASAMRVSSRWAPAMLAPYFVALCVMTGVLFNLPSENLLVWRSVRPMLWHGMSYKVEAEKVLDLMESSPDKYNCTNVYMTPVDLISGFLYYWGPVTPEEVGMKPIEPNNFETFQMDVRIGGQVREMKLNPIERHWSWEKGQWMDLELALRQQGCLWYQKSYQNCRLGTGRFYSSNDCRWLSQNCETIMSMPDTELFYCERHVDPVAAKKQPPDFYKDENDASRLE